jgi:hypothetical protein
MFNLKSEYLTREALERLGGEVIRTVRYADYLAQPCYRA